MRDYLRFLCVLAAVFCAGASRAASDADWSECKREDGDRAKIIAACARIAGDKRLPPRERAIALNNRGNAYQANKDFGRAVADYDAALRLDPNLGHIYLNRALALKGDGEYARALADANKALELQPGDPVSLRGRGDIYMARGKKAEGDLDAAIADYTEAIRLDPSDSTSYRHRGLAYEAKGDGEHASDDYNKVIQLRAK